MTTLVIEDIPDDLYIRLVERAERNDRTVEDEALAVFTKFYDEAALDDEQSDR